nr:unnamed protein product [Haemonchus contortus]
MVSNSVEFLKAIKKEDGDPDGRGASSNFGKRCPMEPESSISRIDDVRLKHPTKYIIRKAVTPSAAPPLKRIFIGRSAYESKPGSNGVSNIAYDRPFTRDAEPAASFAPSSEVESPVRFWRTPSGKLVKLDSKSPSMTRPSLGCLGTFVRTQPKIIRLANGKLARISTKKIPSPFARGRRITGNVSGGPFSQFARDTGRLDIPSITAKITSSSEPIDIATLIGTGPASFDDTPLFEKTDDSPVVKVEPMDVDETHEQLGSEERAPLDRALMEEAPGGASPKDESQKSQESLEQPLPRHPQPSLAVALKSVADNSQVGDLGKIREQPLFTQDLVQLPLKESCNVCRVIVPGLKKNMISLEARLTGLVETVQNLIMYLNPLDRRAAELAAMETAPPPTAESNAPDLSTVSTSTASRAYHFGDTSHDPDSDRIPSMLLPVACRNENRIEMRTVGADEVVNSMGHRPNVVRFIRQPLKSASVLESSSPMRPTHGRIRFVVADRAKTMRTVATSSGGATATRADQGESPNPKARIHISQVIHFFIHMNKVILAAHLPRTAYSTSRSPSN